MRAKLNNQLNGRISKHNVRILTNPAHSRLRSELADERRGFVKDTGTRNAIFMIRVISESAIIVGVPVFYRLLAV